MVGWYFWAGFLAFLAGMVALDLGAFNRGGRGMQPRQALRWTGIWMAIALAFAGLLLAWRGGSVAGEFLAGYLIEWSLSVDNVFVFVMVFAAFAVPPEHRHRVLFWGVLGAMCLRLAFIAGGVALLDRFAWLTYGFGAVLLFTAVRFLRSGERERSPEQSRLLRWLRRAVPMTESFEGHRLFVRREGRRVATPLLAVLVMIEAADLVFAVDSIPAVLSVTRDSFVVFTSNALAVIGLRSLSFVLAGAVGRFRYLRPGLAVLLAFVGSKMLLSSVLHIPIALSLAVIVGILGAAVGLSALAAAHERT